MKNYIFKVIALTSLFLSVNLYGMHEDLGDKIQRIINYIQDAEKESKSGRIIAESLKERNKLIRENLPELTRLIEDALIAKLEGQLPNVSTEQLKEWKGIKDYLQSRIEIEERAKQREKSPERQKQREIEAEQTLAREKRKKEENKRNWESSGIKITLPDGQEVFNSKENVISELKYELASSIQVPRETVKSLPNLFDYIIAAQEKGVLLDIKQSNVDTLVAKLKDALKQEEEMNAYRKEHGLDISKIIKEINYAKNKADEFQELVQTAG